MKLNDEFKYLLALSSISGIGNTTLKHLLSHFEFAEDICKASEKELLAVPEIDPKTAISIITARQEHNFDVQINLDLPSNTEIIEYTHEKYPAALKAIYDPPPYLFARGNLDLLTEQCFAVVGTRRATSYGLNTVTRLSVELAQAGFCIVSGLAEGIDAQAHQSVIENGGNTIAVLGNGIDIVYPAINRSLYTEIAKKGLIITEFLPGTKPTKYSFPKRNRIISGMAKGVLIIEGGRKSGAMITVDYALEQGRDVFALPGRIDVRNAEGPNWLIQHGAKLTLRANDILEEYGMVTALNGNHQQNNTKHIKLDSESQRIFEALSDGEQNIEILAQLLDINVATLQAKLTLLELKGVVKRVSGRVFGLT